MRAPVLYRIASVLLVLFALGHTVGFLLFRPPTAEGLAVWNAMNQVQFQVKGAAFSYGGFYIGFGLFVTLYLLFAAFLAGHLARLAASAPQTIGALGWTFFALHVGSLALSAAYFSVVPAAFSAVVAACTGAGAWIVQRGKAPSVGTAPPPTVFAATE